MIDFKEYSRQRDIAVKRLKRMGVDAHVPTVKELRASDQARQTTAFTSLTQFLETGPSLARKRESERIHYTREELAERKRSYEREYRRRRVARREEQAVSGRKGKYQSYLKGLKTLGVDLKPSQLPGFFQYMDYRFAQGNASRKYVFDIFVDDYQTLLQKGYKPDQIVADYEKFQANQIAVADRAESMKGISVTDAIASWDKYIGG